LTHLQDKTIDVYKVTIIDGKSSLTMHMCFMPTINIVKRRLRWMDEDGIDVGAFYPVLEGLGTPLLVGQTVYGSHGHVTVHFPVKAWVYL